MIVDRKRKEVSEYFKKGEVDMIGIQEAQMKMCGVVDCIERNGHVMWECVKGGMVCGVNEKSRGRGKEEFALLLSPRVWNDVEAHGWRGLG